MNDNASLPLSTSTKALLRFILEELKRQAIYAHRQQGWLTALWETVAADAELESRLKLHPLYDQGLLSNPPKIDVLLSNIDILIQELK